MPHRSRTKIYHVKLTTTPIEELDKMSKEILATYHVNLQDFSKIAPMVQMEDLFVDLYLNCEGAYVVTNCVIVDDRFDMNIANCKTSYDLYRTYKVHDASIEIDEYLMSDDRIRESALLFVLLHHRRSIKDEKSFFDFLQTELGKKAYIKAYNFFKKEYSND